MSIARKMTGLRGIQFVSSLPCLPSWRNFLSKNHICTQKRIVSFRNIHVIAQLQKDKSEQSENKVTNKKTPQKELASQLLTLYGPIYLSVSIALSGVSFLSLYLLIRSGVDVTNWFRWLNDRLEEMSFGRLQLLQNISPDLGTVAVAYICHKALSPVRFPITVAATPFVARWWKNRKGKSSSTNN